MGKLIAGAWQPGTGFSKDDKDGKFVREDTVFHNKIDPTGRFAPVTDRYHLYVSYACPWAHRTLIFRQLKELQAHIGISVVHPHLLEQGWSFGADFAGATGDLFNGHEYLYQVYTAADNEVTSRVTVPVLWDKVEETIVNNESAEIIRFFNSQFNELTGNTNDYYPEDLRAEIDELNDYVYHNINNGVYKVGFATTQGAYEEAFDRLFAALDKLEERLAGQGPYLFGETITEADWRLFVTLIRFDPVYVVHFKCNHKRIADYPALSAYVLRLYEHPGIAQTCNFEHIKAHYYYSHVQLNPNRIVAKGPAQDLPTLK
jgi:glutathionyl-hydroquinone reductase